MYTGQQAGYGAPTIPDFTVHLATVGRSEHLLGKNELTLKNLDLENLHLEGCA